MSPELPLVPASDPSEAPAATQSVAPLWAPGTKRTLTADQKSAWDKRVTRSEQFQAQFVPQWERGLKRYCKVLYAEDSYDVNALLDFAHVETKKSHMFFRTPEVQLPAIDPKDPTVPWIQILPLRQKYLNHKLGATGTNAKRVFHKGLLDALAASGKMVFKVGYEVRALPHPSGQMVPVWSKCFISRVSPMKHLWDADFFDTDFDQCPWQAVKGEMAASQARSLGWAIPDDFEGSGQREGKTRFTHDISIDVGDPMIEYVEIHYKASLYDKDVFNPDLYRILVLVKGIDEPVYYVDSPEQDLTPEGSLTDDSLVGSQIHVGVLRDMPDSAVVASDLTVGEQLSIEVNKFRTDLTKNRTNRQPFTLVSDAVGQVLAEKLLKDRGGVVPAHHIQAGGAQDIVAVIQAGTEPRDNYAAQDYAERDWQKAIGSSDRRTGAEGKKKVTATEIRATEGNADARDEAEKDNARECFISLVRKFDTCLQRHATPQDLAKVLGAQGAMVYEQWKMLPGKYSYNILPDAGQYVDAKERRTGVINEYQLLRKDERVNVDDLLTMVSEALGRDPSTFIAPQQDKTTEPPSSSVNFKGEDSTNPAMGNLLLDFCANAGIKLRPETIQAFAKQHAQYEADLAAGLIDPAGKPIGADSTPNGHGGSAPQTEPINKHATERTGKVQGSVQ